MEKMGKSQLGWCGPIIRMHPEGLIKRIQYMDIKGRTRKNCLQKVKALEERQGERRNK